MKVNVLGAGRVAGHLANAFVQAGHEVAVWNRGEESLCPIRERLGCLCTTRMEELPKQVDMYIISVKDDVVSDVATQLYGVIGETNAIVAHTAGSLSMDLLKQYFQHCGVLYPMQTFSKDKVLDYTKIPFFVEGNAEVVKQLKCLAEFVSKSVFELDSEHRKYLHLSSVFACNFVNHCFAVSEEILKGIDIPFSVMIPLIEETVDKVSGMSPRDGQTGPAVREDHNIMEAQMELLKDEPRLKQIYQLMSENIIDYKKDK